MNPEQDDHEVTDGVTLYLLVEPREAASITVDGTRVEMTEDDGSDVGSIVVQRDREIELMIVPVSGYTFRGWGGDYDGSDRLQQSIRLTPHDDMEITATLTQ